MTTATDLQALFAADPTDPTNRAALADALDEAGNADAARVLREGSRTASGVAVELVPDFLGSVTARFTHPKGPAVINLREWRVVNGVAGAVGVGTVSKTQTQVCLSIPRADWDAVVWVLRQQEAARKAVRDAAETPESRARKELELKLDRMAADMDREDSHL